MTRSQQRVVCRPVVTPNTRQRATHACHMRRCGRPNFRPLSGVPIAAIAAIGGHRLFSPSEIQIIACAQVDAGPPSPPRGKAPVAPTVIKVLHVSGGRMAVAHTGAEPELGHYFLTASPQLPAPHDFIKRARTCTRKHRATSNCGINHD